VDSFLFSFFFFTPTHSFRLGVSDDDEKKTQQAKEAPGRRDAHHKKMFFFSFMLLSHLHKSRRRS
jgi:hypothetical protein